MTANFSVCMCTDGVSLYRSTASHPLSLFTQQPPPTSACARSNQALPGGYITCLAAAIVRFR